MKSLLLTISILLLIQISGYSQVHTFNRNMVFVNDSVSESIYTTVELAKRKYVIGYSEPQPGMTRTAIAEIDSLGDRLWTKCFGDTTMFIQPYKAVATSDGNIMMTGMMYNWLGPTTPFLTVMVKFNPEGDTLWTRILNINPYPGEYSCGNNIIQTSDQGFAVTGDGPMGGIIYKTDPDGTVQWTRSIYDDTAVNISRLISIYEIPGKKYLVSGTWEYPHVWGGKWNGLLCLFDSTGGTIWSDTITDNYNVYSAWDYRSGIITVSNTPASSYGSYSLIHVSHYTLDGTFIKERYFGKPFKMYESCDLLTLPDTTFLVCGIMSNDTSYLFNFNINYDSIFFRSYLYKDTDSIYHRWSWIYTGMVCWDGGMLFGGEYITIRRGEAIPSGWILKTDRYCCVDQGCDPNGIYIIKQPQSATVHVSDTVVFSLQALGDSLKFTWQLYSDSIWVGTPVTATYNAMGDSLFVFTGGLPVGVYRFRCMVTNAHYTVCSNEGIMQVILGINDQVPVNDPEVYPNPVTNTLFVKSTKKIHEIDILNYLGQVIHTPLYLEDHLGLVEMENLPPGIYLLRINLGNRTALRKIIKK
jgi:hypothetical protein